MRVSRGVNRFRLERDVRTGAFAAIVVLTSDASQLPCRNRCPLRAEAAVLPQGHQPSASSGLVMPPGEGWSPALHLSFPDSGSVKIFPTLDATMFHLLWMFIVGIVVGALARLIMPGS